MMNKILRYTLAALLAACAVLFLLPLTMGVRHIGVFYPVVILLIFIWMLLRPAQLRCLLTGRRRVLWRTLLALFAAGLVCIDIVLGLMIRQALNRPTDDAPRTVLVLGCEVRGLRPSPMLSARIDSAYDYLTAHPEAVCVACGGMADDEIISEAQCIRDELVRRGIDPQRIYMEEKSENTAQNIAFAAEVIRQNGLQAQSLGCRSYRFLGPCYWAREVIAVGAALVLGR